MVLREEVSYSAQNDAGGEKLLNYGNKSANVPMAALHCVFVATHFSDDGEVITLASHNLLVVIIIIIIIS